MSQLAVRGCGDCPGAGLISDHYSDQGQALPPILSIFKRDRCVILVLE